jgi:hypothetical protein
MCYPPLSWQTFDIDFTAARFDKDGNKTANPRLTLLHNGVKVHDNVEVKKGSTRGDDPRMEDKPRPIQLQNHGGDPVYFRNVWVVEPK